MRRKSLAIPIRLVNFSDSSQVLTFFTRELGLVDAIAKGAHRERNAFQGPFDLAVLWDLVFVERPPERGLSIITDGAVVDGFQGARSSFRRWAGAGLVLEYLRAVGTAGESAGDLFDLAALSLRALGEPLPGPQRAEGDPAAAEAAWVAAVLASFEARALRVLGLHGPAAACADCRRPWSGADRPVFFSSEAGGIVCGRCRAKSPHRRGRTVSGRAIRALGELAEAFEGNARDEGGGAALARDPRLLAEVLVLLGDVRAYHLDREFAMVRYAISLSP